MTCDEYRRAVLAGETSPAMDAHVVECDDCSRTDPGRVGARRMLADAATWQEPSRDLEERILAVMAGGGGDDRPVSLRPVGPAARSRFGRLGWFATVAAIVAVAIVAATLLRPSDPDWEVALVGVGVAPQADAAVAGWNSDAGTRLRLDASGLPPAPDGHVYEVWLSRDDVSISAGSFRTGEGVDLWTGVHRSEFPRVWVTLEPIDDDPYPSGAVVLDMADDAYARSRRST